MIGDSQGSGPKQTGADAQSPLTLAKLSWGVLASPGDSTFLELATVDAFLDSFLHLLPLRVVQLVEAHST